MKKKDAYLGLQETVISMISNYPFYANLISIMDKKLTDKVPIAGVSITTRVNLFINPTTFNPLPLEVRVGILIHECMHIIHDHISRSKGLSKSFNKAMNIAADRAINEKIHVLTRNNKVSATIPDSLPIGPELREAFFGKKNIVSGEKIEEGQNEIKFVTKKNFQDSYKDKQVLDGESMEYYYKFLKQNAKKGDGDGPGDFDGDMETIDSHEGWEEGGNEDVVREITKSALNKAARKTSQGNIPGDVQEALDLLNKNVVNWKKELRTFVAHCQNTVVDTSRKKRNRRYGIIHPGIVKRPELRLGVIYDSSGSVATPYLQQFFAEIKKIHSLGIDIFLVECDSTVHSAKVYNPKEPIVAKGRGGTAFQPGIDEMNKQDVDAIVFFTDGGSSETIKVDVPFMWAICPPYDIPAGGHRYIKIEMPKEN